MAYVYTHTRVDTNDVFYVGISRFGYPYTRAHTHHKRNKFWKHIVNKTSFTVTIIKDDISWGEACKLERELILKYGRRDLKTGTLCNWTNGGEGSNGAIVSIETRIKISLAKTGTKRGSPSEETRKKQSKSTKGRVPKNLTFLHSPECRKKASESNKKNYSQERKQKTSERFTNNNPRARKVVDTKTGIIFNKMKDALIFSGLNIHHSSFSMMLSGKRKNTTTYAYAD